MSGALIVHLHVKVAHLDQTDEPWIEDLEPAARRHTRSDMLNLVTSLGDLDLSFHPSGTGGFEGLITRKKP